MFAGLPPFTRPQTCNSRVLLLPCLQAMPGPNAFLDECEAIISVSIDDGSLSENQLREILASFGHLHSFSPSNGVRFFPAPFLLVPDRLIACCSPTLSTIPTRDAPRRSSTTCRICTPLEPVFVPNSSPLKSSPRTSPLRALLRNLAEFAHAA